MKKFKLNNIEMETSKRTNNELLGLISNYYIDEDLVKVICEDKKLDYDDLKDELSVLNVEDFINNDKITVIDFTFAEEKLLIEIEPVNVKTYDIHFDNEHDRFCFGLQLSLEECKNFIKTNNNGKSINPLFKKYKNGTICIWDNDFEECGGVYIEDVK